MRTEMALKAQMLPRTHTETLTADPCDALMLQSDQEWSVRALIKPCLWCMDLKSLKSVHKRACMLRIFLNAKF